MYHYLGFFPENKEIIAIIGPRRPIKGSSASEILQHQRDCDIAYHLAQQAARKDVVVLSGLATGIDTAAHLGCLDAGGITVAVVPFGLSAPISPAENRSLFHQIVHKGGCIVSQFKPKQPAAKWTFIVRDKTQAELSSKIVVVGTFPPNGLIVGGTRHCALWGRKMGKPLFHYREFNGQYVIYKDQQVSIGEI
ncbi:Rossmann fold nucleotide-binding protein involved in DNA uptake-like protein [Desulforamulus reducens MI-1]|uniref:Rossmann fold nucleotide-binding protein involved in DNA uptake-like protein n=1 Tax=Desulforamulus reducens (strain ATCC BAA-1160 / DSM 100696 / MI-1) TaxID=349161 RepID=A4J5U6_DESRM|nr:DNA-processing protein DprA [Desulforamulus reducens]ABO50449.1 Rossmann fold nucleotide-binding protein involved in DNA uptake-like protein [Desulforamulus reducens MI-1]